MNQSASKSTGRVYLAVRPDADAAARIHRLACALKRAHRFDGNIIEPDRLHVSLFSLSGLQERDFQLACEAAAEVRMPPFDVLFDRSASFRASPAIDRWFWLGKTDCSS